MLYSILYFSLFTCSFLHLFISALETYKNSCELFLGQFQNNSNIQLMVISRVIKFREHEDSPGNKVRSEAESSTSFSSLYAFSALL